MGKTKVPTKYGELEGPATRIFFYWMNERHSIYMKREAGQEYPWTNDRILCEYKFTNVFRQLDRVSVDLIERVLNKATPSEALLLFQVVLYRMFNLPETYMLFSRNGLHRKWDEKKAVKLLREAQLRKQKIFTGAYITTGILGPKIDLVCATVTAIYEDRKEILKQVREANTLEHAVQVFSEYPMIGKFIGYELACDLTYSARLMPKPTDMMTWANAGPGAKRGLNRLLGQELTATMNENRSLPLMRKLLKLSAQHLHLGSKHTVDMRAIEHSLCEFDKYMRINDGAVKALAKFTPPHLRGAKK